MEKAHHAEVGFLRLVVFYLSFLLFVCSLVCLYYFAGGTEGGGHAWCCWSATFVGGIGDGYEGLSCC